MVAATHLTAGQRLADIKARADDLLRRMPADWGGWDVETTRAFKVAAKAVQGAGTVQKARSAAAAIAVFYRVPLAALDPHGEGA